MLQDERTGLRDSDVLDFLVAMDSSEQFEYVQLAAEELVAYMRYLQMRLELGKEDDWENCGRDVKMHFYGKPDSQDFLRRHEDWLGKLPSWRIDFYLQGKPARGSTPPRQGRSSTPPRQPDPKRLKSSPNVAKGFSTPPRRPDPKLLEKSDKQLTQQGIDRTKAAGICFSREFQKMQEAFRSHMARRQRISGCDIPLRPRWATAREYSSIRTSTHEYARVRTSTLEYARVRSSTHEYARVRTSTFGYARVRTSTHEYARVRSSTHEYARVRTSTLEYARVRTSTHEYARVRTSTHEYARVRTSTHEYARVRTSTLEYYYISHETCFVCSFVHI